MKQGYEIQVQADLPADIKTEATRWAIQWGEDHKTGYGLGKVAKSDQKTYYNRGSFGRWLDDEDSFTLKNTNLVFRRLSRNRRIFGIVHVSYLERVDGANIEINQCRCPAHRGGQKVKFKTRPAMETVFTWGDIKG